MFARFPFLLPFRYCYGSMQGRYTRTHQLYRISFSKFIILIEFFQYFFIALCKKCNLFSFVLFCKQFFCYIYKNAKLCVSVICRYISQPSYSHSYIKISLKKMLQKAQLIDNFRCERTINICICT